MGSYPPKPNAAKVDSLGDTPEIDIDLTEYMETPLADIVLGKEGVAKKKAIAEHEARVGIAPAPPAATKPLAPAPPPPATDPDEEITDPAIVLEKKNAEKNAQRSAQKSAEASGERKPAPAPSAKVTESKPAPSLVTTNPTPTFDRRRSQNPSVSSRPAPVLAPPGRSGVFPAPAVESKRPMPIQNLPTGQLRSVPNPAPAPAPAPVTPPTVTGAPLTSDLPKPEVQTTVSRADAPMPDLGPADAFMQDPEVSEVMINDVRNVMIEKAGRLTFSGFTYPDLDEVNRITRNILALTGRELTAEQPYVDAMLPDGSRVNIIAPPLTLHGPCITIRKFPARAYGIEDLVRHESIDRKMATFLHACVQGKLNIVVSGGTGSGKTTLLNVLLSFVPKGERVVTIEDTPELVVGHFNSVRLQTKPQTPTSAPISARELVANALRMRPDRLVVGECRRGEAFDMLQAMNTGHEGSMTTLHANSARDALGRLETLCLLAGLDLPLVAIRKQIASAVDLVIHIKRFRSGKRRVLSVSEVSGIEGDTITMQEIFVYEVDAQKSSDAGRFRFTGFVPQFLAKMKENGIELPKDYFR